VANSIPYEDFVARKRAQYGAQFDDSELYPQLRQWFHGPRVKLNHPERRMAGPQRTGTISATTGWRPAFILVYSGRARGSGDVLRADDEVVAYQARSGNYVTPLEYGRHRRRRSRRA
jgi:hypothetical protein